MGNLTNSVKPSSSKATQIFPSILWYEKVYHRVHNSPQLVPIRNHNNPVHTSYPNSLRSIIILYPLMCVGPPNGSFHHKFPTTFLYAVLFSLMRTTFLFHLTLLDLIILIFFVEDEYGYEVCSFFQLPITSSLFTPTFSSAPLPQIFSVYVFPLMPEAKFRTHTKLQTK
jgi:hypothetical protein